jgi:dCMP deaminase
MAVMNKWDRRFMELTETVATWSSCFQENRHVGAIIVKDRRVMTTGYNGAPAGVKSCEEKGECLRRKLQIPSGTKHELCFAVHAEQNAIIQAAKYGIKTISLDEFLSLLDSENTQKEEISDTAETIQGELF